MEVSNVIALDVGNKRIGVAIGNTAARLATPLVTIQNTTDVFEELATMIRGNEVTTVVIGLPRDQNGNETAQSELTRRFADELQRHTAATVMFQDESLTSVLAEDRLRQNGTEPTREAIDAEAAAIILSDYFATIGM